MPRVTQYIRDEDFEAWQAIENKSEFIHNALLKAVVPIGIDTIKQGSGGLNNRDTPIKDLDSEFIPKSYSARKKK